MTDAVHQLKAALDDVPVLLVDDALGVDLQTASDTVSELEVFAPEASIVAVIGPSGSGKSTIVNAIVGASVSRVSPIRPTTTSIMAVGGSSAATVEEAHEFVVTDLLPDGLVVVDTPAWDAAPGEIGSIVEASEHVVVVVTPARYGDAQVEAAITAAAKATNWSLIVNRLPPDDGEREQLLDAIHERLGHAPRSVIVEGQEFEPDDLLAGVRLDAQAIARWASLAADAAAAGRRLARGLTAAASDVGSLEAVIEATPTYEFNGLAVGDIPDWTAARDRLVEHLMSELTRWDDEVAAVAGSRLARRVRDEIADPDTEALEADLDGWRDDTAHRFRRRATVWFRKRSAESLLDRWSWVSVIDADEPVPRRVRRLLRDAFEPSVRQSQAELAKLLAEFAESHRDSWRQPLDEAGTYRPGVLLAAANALHPPPMATAGSDDADG